MPKLSSHFLMLSAAVALAACATATPYRPVGDDGYGYKEQKLESNRYRVSFSGNSNTDKETVRNYLLYRAAEVTLDHDGDYFVVANQDTEQDVQQTTSGVGGIGYPFVYGFGFGGTTTTNRVRKYEAYGVITVHQGNKPADNPMAYDARQIEANLRGRIKRPE